nr:B-cell receptor CD22-like [Oncorhynchus nerka]
MAVTKAGSVFMAFLFSVGVKLAHNGWSVSYTRKEICILKGSSVDLTCFYTYPSGYLVTSTFWFSAKQSDRWRENSIPEDLTEDPGYSGRVKYPGTESGHSTLRITDLREEDSAEYHFSFHKQTSGLGYSLPGTALSITGLQVKVTGSQKLTLTCSTTCPLSDNPTYMWYMNGQYLQEDIFPWYRYLVSSKYAGSYSCAVKGHENLHSPAVCVHGHNCQSVTTVNRNMCALKGTSVDISCTYTYPNDPQISKAFWSNKWGTRGEPEDLSQDPKYVGRVEYRIPGNKENDCTLRFTGLRMSDSAEYRFRLRTILGGKFAGTPVLLTVTDVLLELDPTSVLEGESAILRCTTKCTLGPNTAFIWYKNGQPIPNNYPYSNRLYQNPVSNDDAGGYSCAVVGHDDLHSPEVTLRVRYKPKSTSASVSPSGKIVEGSSVTLTCNSDANPPVQNYTWLKRNVTSPRASGQSYTITKISSEDNGEYYCEARNILGGENSSLIPIYIPVAFLWAPVVGVGVGAVLAAGALVFTYCMLKRRFRGSDHSITDTHSVHVHPDPNSDTYTALINIKSPENEHLRGNTSDTYTTLINIKSPENDKQEGVTHTDLQREDQIPVYENIPLYETILRVEPPQSLD